MEPTARRAILDRRLRERRTRAGLGKPVMLLIAAGLTGFSALIVAVATPVIGGVFAAAKAADALNSIDVAPHEADFQTTRIYDRNNKLLYEFVDPKTGRRTAVTLAQVPETVRDATISIEDKNFYTNPGFDVNGLLRAAYDDFTNQRIVQGGSSITQQLVKNVYLTPEVSWDRKVKEVVIAYSLSKQMSKDQILEMYLNQIYYGNQAYGIEAAAESYFDKTVQKLDLAESAMLAGLPQSPSQYDPVHNLKAAKVRQLEVLNQMVDQGYITPDQAAGAYDEPLHFVDQGVNIQAPHFVFWVRDYLEKKYGANFLYGTGLTIKTTLDLDLNNKAQQIVASDLAKVPPDKNVNNAAIVAIDPKTGQVLAMVGSRDYNQDAANGTMDGKFNAAAAPLQPGSSFKPFAYVTDFMKGRTPATMVLDADLGHTFPDGPGEWYQPKNYDLKFHGWLPLRYTLANSLNIPAVKVLADVGVDQTLATAHAMGITTLQDRQQLGLGLSLVLGAGDVLPVDMASAYGVFATGGVRYPYNPILSITDSKGKVIEQFQQPKPQQVLPAEYAYLISSILADDHAREMEFGPHSALWLADRPVSVKTGTTDQFRANWTIGYTPQISVAVWAGNSNHSPMNNVIGIDGAGPIWHDFMEAALAGQPVETIPQPPNVVVSCVPSNVGIPPDSTNRCWHEVFVKGTERTAVGQSITIGGGSYRGPSVGQSGVAGVTISPSASASSSGSPSPAASASALAASAPAAGVPASPSPAPPSSTAPAPAPPSPAASPHPAVGAVAAVAAGAGGPNTPPGQAKR
ncbi:MAG: PBP1A family penicillin-binding protein [Chloroflexi bacterium]|nr:PBP1A family penicillin-binding protein [Chloroflexota bacterium]